MFSEFQISALCQESGLQWIFKSREGPMYLTRLSQCKVQWSCQMVYSWDNLYHIKFAHPPCHFYLSWSKSMS